MANAKPVLVRAKQTFSNQQMTIRKGQILPADHPIAKAKAIFFEPYDGK